MNADKKRDTDADELVFRARPKSNPISPAHYQRGDLPVECIEVATHMNFNRGNALKYIWRAGLKNDETEDLRKAIQYLRFEVNRLEGRGPHDDLD